MRFKILKFGLNGLKQYLNNISCAISFKAVFTFLTKVTFNLENFIYKMVMDGILNNISWHLIIIK
jgi:hypothetical protein